MLGGVLLCAAAAHGAPADGGGAPLAVWLIVLAGLLEASVSVLFYLTIVALGPVLTMLIMATTPVFSIVFGVIFLRERPGLRCHSRLASPWPACSSPRSTACTDGVVNGRRAALRPLRPRRSRRSVSTHFAGRTASGAPPPS